MGTRILALVFGAAVLFGGAWVSPPLMAQSAQPPQSSPQSPDACSGVGNFCVYNVRVLTDPVQAGQSVQVQWNSTGVINYYGIGICRVNNASEQCWPAQYTLTAWPQPYYQPIPAYVPACTPPGLYKAIVFVGQTTEVGTYDWSLNAFTVTAGNPCITSVTADTPAGQGFTTTVRWETSSQTRYAIDLLDANGGYLSAITGWVSSSSARTHAWAIPQSLTPGIYRVAVKVDNGTGTAAAMTAPFEIQPTPTVSNVTFVAVDSCFGASATYAGKPVQVSWTSTNQARWELYDCPGSTCGSSPVLSGTGSAQSTTWTPPPSASGDRRLRVKAYNSTSQFSRDATSASTLTLESRPAVSVRWQYVDLDVQENAGTTNVQALVTTSPSASPLPDPVVVQYRTEDLTAVAGVDYSRRDSTTHGPITFAACQASGSLAGLPVAINISDDTLDEDDKSFLVRLTSASGASVGNVTEHYRYIRDDDPMPSLSINDVTPTEGQNAAFVVSLSAPSGRTVSVQGTTANGTALAGSDYTAVNQSVTFNPGQTSRPFQVPTINDTVDEPNETFTVNLSGPQNATITQGKGTGTIVDNDAAPSLSVGDVTVVEGTGGTTTASVPVTLTGSTASTVTVAYATANGSAQAGVDYTAVGAILTFGPGVSTRTIPVPVTADSLHEGDETFTVTLSGASNATIADGQGTVTIQDDDPVPTLAITDAGVVEGNAGGTVVNLSYQLSNPTVDVVTFSWTTADGTALAGADYVAGGGVRTIPSQSTTGTIAVSVTGDALDEDNETFHVFLSSPVNATLIDRDGLTTILDDDPLPALAIGDAAGPEGNDGTTGLSFPVTLSTPSGRDVRVHYVTSPATASAGDFAPVSGEVLLKAGQTAFDVPVAIRGDRRFEPDETFTLNLFNSANATLADASGTGTIANDDDDVVSVENLTLVERPTTVAFTINPPSTGTLVVDYATRDGSALAGQDYEAVSGSLTLAGDPVEVKVTLLGDAQVEAPETFNLIVRDPDTGSELARGVATIHDRPIAGDFNGDGFPDLLWRNQADGGIRAWLMAGLTRTSVSPLTPEAHDPVWSIEGTADFDGDLRSDLFWRSLTTGQLVAWLMNGLVLSAEVPPSPATAPAGSWAVVGAGDFDGDTRPDLVWRNGVSGKVVVWFMNGVVRTAGAFTVPEGVADLNWSVQGVGDFDGDGHPDLLWRHALSGRIVVWFMNGVERREGAFTAPIGEPDLDWRVEAVSDFTDDGRADIVWRHSATGELRVWLMDKALRLQELRPSPDQEPDTVWTITGPR